MRGKTITSLYVVYFLGMLFISVGREVGFWWLVLYGTGAAFAISMIADHLRAD